MKAAFGKGCHGEDVDLSVRETEGHRGVVGRAFPVEVPDHREVELDIVALEAPANAAGAADDGGERTVGELGLEQYVVGFENDLDLGLVGAPDEHSWRTPGDGGSG